MSWTEDLTRYVCNFVDELAAGGLAHAVISPGSRSTPLALAFAEHKEIREWVIVDERSAAFFALGIAKASRKPVVLICTSGTAAANYYPAIVEAFYSHVPLVVLTADRPHELRDVDAPQAIDQIHLYGQYAKWFHEMALPESSPRMLSYARSKAARSLHEAEIQSGPVHLNFPFREPLVLDFSLENVWGERLGNGFYPLMSGNRTLNPGQFFAMEDCLKGKRKGLLVAGLGIDLEASKALLKLARNWAMPILADPLSQLRQLGDEESGKYIIDSYDALFKTEEVRTSLRPDYVIRFGAMPVSKTYRFYLEQHADIPQFIVSDETHFREPTGNRTSFIHSDCITFAEEAGKLKNLVAESGWIEKWFEVNSLAREVLSSSANEFMEGTAVLELAEQLPSNSILFSGNSMAIRDLDTFMFAAKRDLSVMANRGANGIDGVISSACGAAASGKRTTLLIGDLSFYHDMNGLFAAKHYKLPLTIVLVNNSGGGIFSFLPQANDKRHFEALFGTPVDLDFGKAAELYGADYVLARNGEEFSQALASSYDREGLSIIEVQTDRQENEQWHRDKWSKVNERISKKLFGE
ncbi:2-succinyl-5-enolpyruvyl-6-hydroxy-3-cyclohexene-1-carboxylic-acid synthase [Aciduricibacillus chroicocephali]|uniref:2-succinyl-5-enolpyruvyl-6-hydroxy-3-cyclohexene-1-carboxylate synthase n=1 Tax=Aciduricibacillus chroicocephali TaxID=3054939 RepID=A0ABY9KSH1_9BACI|nr:2-succinyl-5-enolpyruvyl-6-hydroxy-3-cyclohexene-1-carboxylic-acid synthase [Bacillaceae bacterium 44XB]